MNAVQRFIRSRVLLLTASILIVAMCLSVLVQGQSQAALSRTVDQNSRGLYDVLVQAKRAPEETVLVGINLAATPRTVEIDPAGLWPVGATPVPLLGASPPVPAGDGRLQWQLPPLSTVMLAVPLPPIPPAM